MAHAWLRDGEGDWQMFPVKGPDVDQMIETILSALLIKEEDLMEYVTVIDRTMQQWDNSQLKLAGSITITADHVHALNAFTRYFGI